jgi:hypothetical protein
MDDLPPPLDHKIVVKKTIASKMDHPFVLYVDRCSFDLCFFVVPCNLFHICTFSTPTMCQVMEVKLMNIIFTLIPSICYLQGILKGDFFFVEC